MTIKKTSLLSVLAVLLSFGGQALAADFLHSAPAVQGYDVVSYFTGKRPVRGNGHYVTAHEGALYQFSSKENLAKFEKNPEKYVPAYNGYCAFGVSVGKKFVGDPEVWRIVDGKVYLNLDENIQDDWLKDVDGRVASADKKWPGIKDKDPASL